ncbi:DUF4423 domain-containing protein [Halobacteriovorax sp. DA5]|uniref:DUF4423 domain-containing protein n=1 Tax=unclassified Halobacteriovorax TaxID=2639665 RepID=UPI000CD10162|nr:DUF4423 domain-containing protein [Halobacteriovorax sp. DA5]POB14479.1 hypothetical protein C0Z22_05135 [Halobacteriovorax sp. DA5]
MSITTDFDFDELSQQLIRSIRGDKSQEWVNQKLGASSNIVHRWEKGHSKTSWEDFLSLCDIFKIDLKNILLSYLRYQDTLQEPSKLLDFIFSNKSLNDISSSCGITTSKLRRLKSGETGLCLNDFLQIVFGLDEMESMALVFELTSQKSIPLLDNYNKMRLEITKHYFDNPNIGIVLICLDLPAYKKLSFHQDSFLAKATGLSIKEVNDILVICENNKLIEKVDGIYRAGKIKISDRGSRQQMNDIRKFWLEKAIANIKDKSEKDAYGSMVFNASQSARQQIIALYLRFFEDFKKIVSEDTDEDVVTLVLNFNLFNPGSDDIND